MSWHQQMWPDVGSPWRIAIRWEELHGRLEAVGFTIEAAEGDVPLTTSVLRRVPFATLVQDTHRRRMETVRMQAELPSHDVEGRSFGNLPARARKALPKYERSAERRGRPAGYGPDHLSKVANLYSEAWLAGLHPTKAVAEEFSVSRSAAAKWVARARQAGLLAPTRPRTPGGANPQEDQ